MRIGTRLSGVVVACSLASLAAYGVWNVSIRRDQLLRELHFEEASLATVLRSTLELSLDDRDTAEVRTLLERLSSAERIAGIAVHDDDGAQVAASDSLAALLARSPRDEVRRALVDGEDRVLRLELDGRNFLIHVLPLRSAEGAVNGVAEVWRDLGYIEGYLRATKLRLMLLALGIGTILTFVIVVLTRRSVTEPASALIAAMDQVAGGNLGIRVAEGQRPPEGELGDIARSFDRLAHSLQQANAALEASAAERNALASRLRQSERLATLGQVVAEVAHEIGTPLNVISGRAEMLARAEANPAVTSVAQAIADQARRITRIMQRLLHVARERMPVLEEVNVLEVARRTADFLGPDFASARVQLAVTGDEAAVARGDEDLLQQVLINLVNNALQASPRGGVVRLQVRRDAGRVVVDVTDEGPGVSTEILPRLFEPFATTKPAGKGTGLGLSLSRSILRQLGGSLRYLEGSSRGAHFQATLLAAGEVDAEAERRAETALGTA